jgi:predicted HTH domain antitoxin
MSAATGAELPEDLLAALEAAGYTRERLTRDAIRHFSGVLYARKVLTLGQAARLAGMSLWEFIPFLGEQSIPVADYNAAETARELETSRWLSPTSNE